MTLNLPNVLGSNSWLIFMSKAIFAKVGTSTVLHKNGRADTNYEGFLGQWPNLAQMTLIGSRTYDTLSGQKQSFWEIKSSMFLYKKILDRHKLWTFLSGDIELFALKVKLIKKFFFLKIWCKLFTKYMQNCVYQFEALSFQIVSFKVGVCT